MAIIGLLLGILFIGSAIALGGQSHLFLSVQALLVVLGGTLAATLLTMRRQDIGAVFRAAGVVFFRREPDLSKTVNRLLKLSQLARRRGFLALSEVSVDHAVLKRCCDLLAENAKVKLVDRFLQMEIENLIARHARVQAVFSRMGSFAPSFGMIGTVIGLIQMLAQMNSPADMGPAMSLALLTTLYGGMLAFMVFQPVVGRLKNQTAAEVAELELIREGVRGIVTRVSTVHLQEQLHCHLPSSKRTVDLRDYRDTTTRKAA